ncbi:hypothetical protein C8R43DRAFT_1111282 [Mycena crocata]|nr:hypothetical protein C8R43DRAFT_1111282 [Mycena crocata]
MASVFDAFTRTPTSASNTSSSFAYPTILNRSAPSSSFNNANPSPFRQPATSSSSAAAADHSWLDNVPSTVETSPRSYARLPRSRVFDGPPRSIAPAAVPTSPSSTSWYTSTPASTSRYARPVFGERSAVVPKATFPSTTSSWFAPRPTTTTTTSTTPSSALVDQITASWLGPKAASSAAPAMSSSTLVPATASSTLAHTPNTTDGAGPSLLSRLGMAPPLPPPSTTGIFSTPSTAHPSSFFANPPSTSISQNNVPLASIFANPTPQPAAADEVMMDEPSAGFSFTPHPTGQFVLNEAPAQFFSFADPPRQSTPEDQPMSDDSDSQQQPPQLQPRYLADPPNILSITPADIAQLPTLPLHQLALITPVELLALAHAQLLEHFTTSQLLFLATAHAHAYPLLLRPLLLPLLSRCASESDVVQLGECVRQLGWNYGTWWAAMGVGLDGGGGGGGMESLVEAVLQHAQAQSELSMEVLEAQSPELKQAVSLLYGPQGCPTPREAAVELPYVCTVAEMHDTGVPVEQDEEARRDAQSPSDPLWKVALKEMEEETERRKKEKSARADAVLQAAEAKEKAAKMKDTARELRACADVGRTVAAKFRHGYLRAPLCLPDVSSFNTARSSAAFSGSSGSYGWSSLVSDPDLRRSTTASTSRSRGARKTQRAHPYKRRPKRVRMDSSSDKENHDASGGNSSSKTAPTSTSREETTATPPTTHWPAKATPRTPTRSRTRATESPRERTAPYPRRKPQPQPQPSSQSNSPRHSPAHTRLPAPSKSNLRKTDYPHLMHCGLYTFPADVRPVASRYSRSRAYRPPRSCRGLLGAVADRGLVSGVRWFFGRD